MLLVFPGCQGWSCPSVFPNSCSVKKMPRRTGRRLHTAMVIFCRVTPGRRNILNNRCMVSALLMEVSLYKRTFVSTIKVRNDKLFSEGYKKTGECRFSRVGKRLSQVHLHFYTNSNDRTAIVEDDFIEILVDGHEVFVWSINNISLYHRLFLVLQRSYDN